MKNIVAFDKIAFLVSEDLDPAGFASCFLSLFKTDGYHVDLIDVTMDKSNTAVEESSTANSRLEKLKEALSMNGIDPNALKTIKGPPMKVADMFREYGLVVSSLAHSMRKKNPLIELLGRIASPILICWH